MTIKIQQLLDALNKNPLQYESLIEDFFNTYDIDLLKLTYNNLQNDLLILSKNIYEFYTHILNELKNDELKPKITNFLTQQKYNQWFFQNSNYTIFNETDIKLTNFINSINDKNDKDKTVNDIVKFKKYIKTNTILYQSIYNCFYIYFYIDLCVKSYDSCPHNKLYYDIKKKYDAISNKHIYDYQLYYETPKKNNNNLEDSKKIIQLMFKFNNKFNNEVNLINLYDKIIKDPKLYFNDKHLKSNIKLKPLQLTTTNTHTELTLHKFYTKDIHVNMLKKVFGLVNTDIYNLLKNSRLPICYNNKSFYTLKNDIRINTRALKESNVNIKLAAEFEDDGLFKTVNDHTTELIEFFSKGYNINLDNDKQIIYFYRNSIVDMEFTDDEYANLDMNILNCKERYILAYCSQLPFNRKGIDIIKANFKGGHKASIIIDKEKKEIIFFEPLYNDAYDQVIFPNQDIILIQIIIALKLSKHLASLDGYSLLYSNIKAMPQTTEYKGKLMHNIYKHNIQQIFTDKRENLRDWAGGYCGLWNYLYIYLLIINPHLNLGDIYTFFYKATNIKYSAMFNKLLIRNFAYYIENALVTPNYIIPLTKLDISALDDLEIITINFKNNNVPIELKEMKNEDFYQAMTNKTKFSIEDFIATHTKLASTFKKNYEIAKDIIDIATDFSTYIFAKGGLALYAPDKVNFLKV